MEQVKAKIAGRMYMIDYSKLNDQQLEAVRTIEGPLLILAGAGSGKTSTMTYRAAYMIEQGINPSNIAMLTFTNKAAHEMKERLATLLTEEQAKDVTACTFHSFCALMLRFHGHHIGISQHFTILSPGEDTDIISIVKAYKDKSRFSGKGFPPNGKVCDFISMAINKNLELYDVMCDTKYADFVGEVQELWDLSKEYRETHDMLNYDDILVRFIDLLNMKPDIAERIAKAYCYIMVDEYQDTNPLQDTILRELFRYTKNIAVVGDDMQSLYAFRGAEVENILHFDKRYPGCKTITLFRNYRSLQDILDFSNESVKYSTECIPKELKGIDSDGMNKPRVVHMDNLFDETSYVVGLIKDLHYKKGIPWNEICVVERNSMSSAAIEVELAKEGIDFDKYGGMKFVDLNHVKDLLAYLKIMTNPHDEIAWFRVLQVHRGIGIVNARKISEKCRTDGFETLKDKKYQKKEYGPGLIELYNTLTRLDGKKLQELIPAFINFYYETIKKNIETMDTDEGSRTMYLEELKKHKEDLDRLNDIATGYRSIDSFLDDLLLDNSKLADDEDTGNLVISTIHSVKGLEFQAVIVLRCVDGIFPRTDDIGSKEDNEELRCFYVAITRAKKYLFITCPRYGMIYGKSEYFTPSRYFRDIDEDLYEQRYL